MSHETTKSHVLNQRQVAKELRERNESGVDTLVFLKRPAAQNGEKNTRHGETDVDHPERPMATIMAGW